MPIQELASPNELDSQFNWMRIWAMMAFPSAADDRRHFLWEHIEAWVKQPRPDDEARSRWENDRTNWKADDFAAFERTAFRTLPAHLFSTSVAPRGFSSLVHGVLAGLTLWMVLRLAQHKPESAGRSQAQLLLHSLLKKRFERKQFGQRRLRKTEGTFDLPISMDSIENAWRDYESVSPYFAAWLTELPQGLTDLIFYSHRHAKVAPEFMLFIGWAESLCRMDQTHFGAAYDAMINEDYLSAKAPDEEFRHFCCVAETFRRRGRSHQAPLGRKPQGQGERPKARRSKVAILSEDVWEIRPRPSILEGDQFVLRLRPLEEKELGYISENLNQARTPGARIKAVRPHHDRY